MGDCQQWPFAADHRLHTIVDASGPRIRLRAADLWSEGGRGILDARARRSASRRRHHSLRSHVAASDLQASRVCRSLGDGVLSALPALTTALAIRSAGTHRSGDRLRSSADARVSGALPVVRGGAGTRAGLERCLSRCLHDRFAHSTRKSIGAGDWKAFQAISRLAHAGCKAGDLDVTAFNGRLSPRDIRRSSSSGACPTR